MNSLLLLAGNCLWWRWLRRAIIVSAKEFLLNLFGDLIKPFLGSVRLVLVVADLCLKLSHPAFSGSNLSGQFVSHF